MSLYKALHTMTREQGSHWDKGICICMLQGQNPCKATGISKRRRPLQRSLPAFLNLNLQSDGESQKATAPS